MRQETFRSRSASARGHGVRLLAGVLMMTIAMAPALAGCGTARQTVAEHPSATIGAGAGAVGGALIGGLVADSPTGAVIGGLLGGLAGGAAGHYLGRKERDRTAAVRAVGYSPGQGELVRLESARAVPAQVRPGDTVNLAATYTVLTPGGGTVAVNETRVVRHNGQVVANPSAQFQRTNGTFTSALPITLPTAADPGVYEVTTTVVADGESSTQKTSFVVG